MSTEKELFAEGDLAFKRGQWRPALTAFGGVVRSRPLHFRSRFRIADCLLNLGKKSEALDVYKSIAWHALKAGFPLHALVAVKMVLLVDPDYEDLLLILAEMYSAESDRVDSSDKGPALPQLSDEEADPLFDNADMPELAAEFALSVERITEFPERLPAIPLFSHLDETAFIRVLEKLRLRRYADEESIITEGERGESFFMVADGEVWVKRGALDDDGGVTLGHLRRRSVFGEMALISDEPRQASVIAHGDVDVLELRRSDLIVMAAQLTSVTAALKAFTRERFLKNLTATHAFFSPLNREERHAVMGRFNPVSFDDGDMLIREQEPGPGLYLLLSGKARVSKLAGEERVHLAALSASDICGEMSLVSAGSAHATVVADGPLESLFLSTKTFREIVDQHPELMKFLAGLSEERLRQNRAVLQRRGLLEDDEHIMI